MLQLIIFTVSTIAIGVLAVLLAANAVIITARLSGNPELARRVVRVFLPFARFLRVPGRNPIDPLLS